MSLNRTFLSWDTHIDKHTWRERRTTDRFLRARHFRESVLGESVAGWTVFHPITHARLTPFSRSQFQQNTFRTGRRQAANLSALLDWTGKIWKPGNMFLAYSGHYQGFKEGHCWVMFLSLSIASLSPPSFFLSRLSLSLSVSGEMKTESAYYKLMNTVLCVCHCLGVVWIWRGRAPCF